jgi:hypothetical protein
MVADAASLLEILAREEVKFVLVGNLASVAQGVPVCALTTDIVHLRSPGNVVRLIRALETFHACYPASLRVDEEERPTQRDLMHTDRHLLETSCGGFQIMGAIAGGVPYERLITDSISVDHRGYELRILSLKAMIGLYKQAGTQDEKNLVPILEATQARALQRASPG